MQSPVSRRLVGAMLLTAALAFPLGVMASHGFTDVPDSSTFHDDIDAIADVGVTVGCAANLYCPKDFVTREQMAAFLNRLGALGPGKTPVVNATKLDGVDSTGFLRAGDIVTRQHFPWVPNGVANVNILHGLGSSIIETQGAGTTNIQLALQGPSQIGNRQYGLKSVEVCYGGPVDALIDTTAVTQSTSTGSVVIINSTTNRVLDANECYTVTDLTPTATTGGTALILTLGDDDSAVDITLRAVTATWVPVIGNVIP